ncbi:MAG: phosphate signaling complex protein PhoU [Deltaproteobacteria bacterium]|nr:phosphate signaling complex protein PhoU [Deltaproteobacteria bacterium]
MDRLSSLHKDIIICKDELLKMGGLVEWAVDQAIRALKNRDDQLASQIIYGDKRIDEMENSIDKHCLNMLATQQPVAKDLRFITSTMRICAYLERIADQAVNLAQRTQTLARLDPIEIPKTLLEMGAEAQEMIAESLSSFVQGEIDLAWSVCQRDDYMDDLNRRLLEEMIDEMMSGQRITRRGIELILAGRHLERMGDGATNISEEVVFMVEGTVIRHQPGCELPSDGSEADR